MRPADAYAAAGVGGDRAEPALDGLVAVLRSIDPGRESQVVVEAGHFASVLSVGRNLGVALCTDGVGTKVLVAERLGRFDTIGIDCVAMNVNDILCVGATPLAMVDYIAVDKTDPDMLRQIGEGLKVGAERAGIEIPGGEFAQLAEVIRGDRSPAFDLVGSCFGTVALDRIVSGAAIEPGDKVIGLPSSGIHSNGLTLARRALLSHGGYEATDVPEGFDRSVGEEMLEPTEIYVRAVLDLLRSGLAIHGLAHVTGSGMRNLLRLNEHVGYEIGDPLPPQKIFALIEDADDEIAPRDMYEVFNMGTGFCCVVAAGDSDEATQLLRRYYGTARPIGAVTADAGRLHLPSVGLTGDRSGFSSA